MTDSLTPEERSYRMSLVRGKDTGPELVRFAGRIQELLDA